MSLNQAWIRIFDCTGSGLAYLMFATIFIMARMKKGVGYRQFLHYAALFCLVSALGAFATAWDLYFGTQALVIIQTPNAAIKFLFACYCWQNFSNFVITLRRSEYVDKLKADSLCDRTQRKWNIEVVLGLMHERIESWQNRRAPHESACTSADAAVGELR